MKQKPQRGTVEVQAKQPDHYLNEVLKKARQCRQAGNDARAEKLYAQLFYSLYATSSAAQLADTGKKVRTH